MKDVTIRCELSFPPARFIVTKDAITVKRSAQHFRMPAWLGLFAMLMIFLAPLISSQLADKHHLSMTMPMSGHQMMPHHQTRQSAPMTHHDAGDAGVDLCGYCSLFHHTPALDTTLFLPPGNVFQPAAVIAVGIFSITLADLFPPYQTRAPPVAILFS
ncbi:TPA: DUF2946 domain-containing protein [Serratia odorifera]